jgi:hypothetical protein
MERKEWKRQKTKYKKSVHVAKAKADKREEVLHWFIWTDRILHLPVVLTRLISCVVLKVWQRRYHDVRTLLAHRPLKTQSQLQTMENVQGTSPQTDPISLHVHVISWVLLRIHFGKCFKINFQKHILSTHPPCVDINVYPFRTKVFFPTLKENKTTVMSFQTF